MLANRNLDSHYHFRSKNEEIYLIVQSFKGSPAPVNETGFYNNFVQKTKLHCSLFFSKSKQTESFCSCRQKLL